MKVARTVWRRGKAGDNIKGLPIPIISGGDIGFVERLAVPAQPQCALHRHHPGPGITDHHRPGRMRFPYDRKRQNRPPLHRPETPFATKGQVICSIGFLRYCFPRGAFCAINSCKKTNRTFVTIAGKTRRFAKNPIFRFLFLQVGPQYGIIKIPFGKVYCGLSLPGSAVTGLFTAAFLL